MFPPFVSSFGDQFFAVVINAVGTILSTVLGGVLSASFSAFVTNFLSPMMKNISCALGILTTGC